MTSENSRDHAAAGRNRLVRWLDRRTGIRALLHDALDEPIHGGARFAYVFGSALLFLFLSQIVTGVFLAMYYVPSADHAHTTVAYITKAVTEGSLQRSIHAYGASAIIIVLFLHLAQTFLYGSYKGRRELLWFAGCILLVLMLGMAFTGYLLPWDQKAYFATAVGTNITSEVPGIGSWIKRFMRGGNEMGTLTVSRYFVAHVFFLPALIFAFVAAHVFLFRKAGAAGPVGEDPIAPTQPAESFYPRQVLMDLGFSLALIATLWVFAHFHPADLGPVANSADTQYLPRPEWYYRWFFQWLKYWHGQAEIVGIILIPLAIAVLFFFVPLLDKGRERRPWRRPIAVGSFALVLAGIVSLEALSYHDDYRDPGVAAQLKKQQQETEQFMRTSFEPELSGASLAAANVSLADPIAAKGKEIFEGQSCNTCHGDNGIGTAAGPKLAGISAKLAPPKLAAVLRHPTLAMAAGGMTPVEFEGEDMDALVKYLESLK